MTGWQVTAFSVGTLIDGRRTTSAPRNELGQPLLVPLQIHTEFGQMGLRTADCALCLADALPQSFLYGLDFVSFLYAEFFKVLSTNEYVHRRAIHHCGTVASVNLAVLRNIAVLVGRVKLGGYFHPMYS